MNRNIAFDQLLPGKIKPGLTLFTGPRGAGKTHWCLALADYAHSRGLNLHGLISPAVMDGRQKVAIDLLDLASGKRRRLAHRKEAADGDILTEDWRMVADTLQWGNALLKGIKSCDLFILDEVGPLEFEQGLGFAAGLDFVDTRRNIPCFVVVRPSFLDAAQKRWPWAEVLDVSA